MAVSYSQCPSKVKVFYKVSSNTDKNKKAFPESFIEFVGTAHTWSLAVKSQNQFSLCVQNIFNTKNWPLLWILIVDMQYQDVILWKKI